MCALKAHNNKPILEKIYWELTTFSIINKTFPKMNLLMCVLRAHINRTHLCVQTNELLTNMSSFLKLRIRVHN